MRAPGCGSWEPSLGVDEVAILARFVTQNNGVTSQGYGPPPCVAAAAGRSGGVGR